MRDEVDYEAVAPNGDTVKITEGEYNAFFEVVDRHYAGSLVFYTNVITEEYKKTLKHPTTLTKIVNWIARKL